MPAVPKAGEILDGKYRIESLLGEGGMGYVLLATHLQLDERVAIKMLLPALAEHAETVERFLREAKAARKIRGDHVATVYDIAKTPEGTPYIAMEFLEGADLAQVLERRGKLPVHEAVDYVLQACEALAQAHALRIVHRDLKPSNLFLTKSASGVANSCVKVLDFGISKMSNGPAEMAMTRTSAMMGTPLYMSPEQLVSARMVDERADIWAIGVILYELIAGQPPFMAATLPELGALVLSGNAPDLRAAAPHCPPPLAAAVARCLRKEVADRFKNLSDFADAIAPFGSASARTSADHIATALGTPATSRGSDPNLIPTGPAPSSAVVALPQGSNAGAPALSAAAASAPGWAQTNGGAQRRRSSTGVFVAVGGAVVTLALAGAIGWKVLSRSGAGAAANVAPPSVGEPAREPSTLPKADTSERAMGASAPSAVPSASSSSNVATPLASASVPAPAAPAPASASPSSVAATSASSTATSPSGATSSRRTTTRRTAPAAAAAAASAAPAAPDRHQF